MRYFAHLAAARTDALFYEAPQPFFRDAPRELLRFAVGALLYTPATGRRLADMARRPPWPGLKALGFCLEDSVGEAERQSAQKNLMRQVRRLTDLTQAGDLNLEDLPLLFVRVKDYAMLEAMQPFFQENIPTLTGVILPKVNLARLQACLPLVAEINRRAVSPFYVMPILEDEEIAASAERLLLLQRMRELLDQYYPYVLNIRIGATDCCGLYGIRRSAATPSGRLNLLAAYIADIARIFALRDRYTISAPVWEYFPQAADPGSGRGPVEEQPELAGLFAECDLDLQNGLIGKTAIHPSQLLPIQAMHAVERETYADAMDIAEAAASARGVFASAGRNKMNEPKPHEIWARRILKQAAVYGVLNRGVSRLDLWRAATGGGV
ncbi:MAG: HpcH/HpaI aldolase/citrate lyase family protein [Gracilibacteraceae bacterium]|jgi:citrate lyase beta subunit|nr:HpcH/HpaI aldolase/citrate lyase family protein [Gracilibacteraceae bacterium]